MAFMNFIYVENEENLSFLPKEPSNGLGNGSLSVSMNTDPHSVDSEPSLNHAEHTVDFGDSPKPEVFVVHPGSVAARIKDRKCKIIGGSFRPPVKRKLALGLCHLMLLVLKLLPPRMILNFTFSDDEGLHDVFELKYANACHLKISSVTPSSWKNHFENHMDIELLDLHDQEECEELRSKCKAAMTDFGKNSTVVAMREKMSTLSPEAKEHKANLDRMLLESQKWAGYHVSLTALESKVDSLEANKARLEAVEASLKKEIDDVKCDMMEVVLKIVPYVALNLIHSNELGRLVGKLVSSAILYKRCDAFEKVADMKEPFDLLKNQVIAPSSQRATPSSTPASNLMSPPAAVSSVQPQSSQGVIPGTVYLDFYLGEKALSEMEKMENVGFDLTRPLS
uniref:Uncharacterized protein n=1 Tax=Tanacetum cinerariifolium TaxID=118510 RepID=A0A6L2JDU2_TANCI|nr:hypothetical protein [Tanacetum cinerariifolium]